MFQNVFADIDANNIIALCSCLVFDEKSEDPITNNLDLMKAFETCKGIARNVAEIMARVSADQTFPYTSNNPQLKMIEDAGSLVDIFNVAGALVLSSFYCFQIFQVENKIPIDVEEYVQKLKPQLMDVVLHWLEGKRFHEIMTLGSWHSWAEMANAL